MGSSLDLVKTLVVPALISLSIYLLFGYLIIPFFRRYHQRYAHYLPLNSISAHTLTLRERLADALMHFFLPSSWGLRRRGMAADENNNHDAISIYDEEGEHMTAMDITAHRREALEARRSTSPDAQVRLSRDLEEGFMDDSSEEEEEGERRGVSR